jgi:hypothetical protein
MINKFRLPVILGTVAVVFISALILVTFALADEGVSQAMGPGGEGQAISALVTPVPGGPGYVSLSAIAFQPFVSTDTYGRMGQTLHCISGNCVFGATIALPHQATITKFVAYYYDNSPSDISIDLEYASLFEQFANSMAILTSSGQSGVIRFSETTSINPSVIDNQSNAYLIGVQLPPTIDVYLVGVRIDYSYPAILPTIMK